MADQTQLLRIVYASNVDALKASEDAAKRADAATEKLRASASKLGDSGAAASKKYQTSIGAVRAEMERTKALIEVTSRSETKLLNERIAKYKQLKTEVDKFNKSLEDSEKATKGSTQSFGQLYTAVKLFLTAGLLKEVVSTALEMAKLSGNVEGVTKAFARLPNSVLLLESLRKGTHGAVGDLELMQKALQANNFRIPLQQLGTLFEFAATKAQQTGQEVNHLVDYIVSGIGYRSIKRLDDLGFTANRVREALGGISLQAATTAQVMDAVTKLMNEDLQKTGGYTETAATKVEKLEVAWGKFKLAVADRITQDGGFIDYLNKIAEALRIAVISKKQFDQEFIKGEAVKFVQDFITSLNKLDVSQKNEEIQQKLNSTIQVIGQYNDQIKATQRVIENIKGFGFPGFQKENIEGAKRYNELVVMYGDRAREVFIAEIKSARDRLAALKENKKILEQTIPILRDYMESIIPGDEQVEQLGLIAQKLQEIENVGEQIQAAKSTTEIHKLNNELAKLNGELADLKAFGTTKQFLEVEGKLRLVPVVDPKNVKKVLDAEPIFKKGVSIPATLDFTVTKTLGTRQATNQLQEQIDALIAAMPANIAKPLPIALSPYVPMTEWDKIGQEFADNWQAIVSQGLNDTANIINAGIQAEADEYETRINRLKAFYDEQIVLAGDNQNQKDRLRLREKKEEDKLRREAFEADKRAKRSQAVVNGAVGITNAFATLPYPAAIVASVLIAASTAAQIATINKEKPRFAKGKVNIPGPGTGTSDSIDAKISKGESVIAAAPTQRSPKLLEGINNGKIDDSILKTLHITKEGVRVNALDDSRIVNAIKAQRFPDIVRIGSEIYEKRKADDGFSQRLRRKNMTT